MNEVVKSLYEDTEKFNKEAVEKARKNKEETSKCLIAELEKIIDEVDENTLEVPLFVDYAIFLLAEFQEKKAYPVILKLLNLRNIDNDEFLGYGIMDQLPSIITSVFDGNYDALNKIIEDKEKEWYLKARLLASYSYFYDHHMIKKEELIAYLRKLVNHNNDEQNMINNTILDIITDCHLFEMMEDVKKMYDEDVLEYELSESYADFIDRIFNYDNREEIVSKSVEEYMAGWYHFDKEIKPQLEKNTFQKFANYLEKEAEQYEIDYSKVGRNDKCPCGSGKKFKKCCIDKVKSRLSYQKYINQALSKYPKENNNPDEKDFYSYYKKEYIEIDHLLYKALKRKEIPLFIKRDIKKELDQDYEYLNQAYPLIKNIIEQNNFKTIEEYDKKVEIHYSLYSFFIRYSRCIIEKAKMDKSEYIQKLEELIKYFYDHFEIAKEYEYVFLNKINEYYILSKKEKEAIAFFENKLKDSDIRSRYDAYDYLFQDYIDIYSYDEARRKIEDLIEKEKDETLKEELEILKLDYLDGEE